MKKVAHMYTRATFLAPIFSSDLKLQKLKQLCWPAKSFPTANRMSNRILLNVYCNVRFGLVNIPLSMLCDQVVVGKAASPNTNLKYPQ